MIGPLGRQGPAATLRQQCPQMTQRRCMCHVPSMRPNVPVDAVRAVDHDDGGGDDHDGRVDDHVVPVVVRRAPPKLSRLRNGKKQIFDIISTIFKCDFVMKCVLMCIKLIP